MARCRRMDNYVEQGDKFCHELRMVINRWEEESDLDLFEITKLSCDVLNGVCEETTIEFDPDYDCE